MDKYTEGGGGEFLIRRVTILYCLSNRGFRIPVVRNINLKRKTLHPFKDLPLPGPTSTVVLVIARTTTTHDVNTQIGM